VTPNTPPRRTSLRKKLDRIDVAETALDSELENTPEGMPEPAVAAYRQRLRARFTDLYAERTTLQAQLDTLTAPSDEPASDPALLDELPTLGDIVTGAPPALIERLLAVFDLSAVYNRDKHQLTIHATITDTTPQAVHDLLTDPRADHNQRQASDPGPTGHDQVSHLTRPPGSSPRTASVPAADQDRPAALQRLCQHMVMRLHQAPRGHVVLGGRIIGQDGDDLSDRHLVDAFRQHDDRDGALAAQGVDRQQGSGSRWACWGRRAGQTVRGRVCPAVTGRAHHVVGDRADRGRSAAPGGTAKPAVGHAITPTESMMP
jgi:hypothetical protein